MCGRYSLAYPDICGLEDRFTFRGKGLDYKPRYNIAPTQGVLAVFNDGEVRHGEYLRWGLIPFWAKDPSIGNRMINARGETVVQNPVFRNLVKRKRCLLLADGFYEWSKEAAIRMPMRITLKGGDPFAFAGLWDTWETPAGDISRSCTIITTRPNTLVETIHNRMPVILPYEAESLWLDRKTTDPRTLTSLLIPFPADSMEAYPVSSVVNSPKNETAECIKPLRKGVRVDGI